jgi:hypothetical protein
VAATLVYLSDLHNAVLTALAGPGGFPPADVHDGKVTDPSLIAGTNRVQPYALVWTAPGDNAELPLAGPDGGEEASLYVTVAADTPTKTLDAVNRARRTLDGAWLSLSGHQVGIRWLTGYRPPPPTRDPDVTPDRWFVPLIFTALI